MRSGGLSVRRACKTMRVATASMSLVVAMPRTAIEAGDTETIRVDLEVRTGGSLRGLVVDHTDHGLVVVHDNTPYVFSWGELESGSAFAAKFKLISFERGGDTRLTAEDHFELGRFALQHDRRDLAARSFRHAVQLDPEYETQVSGAFEEHRARVSQSGYTNPILPDDAADKIAQPPKQNHSESPNPESVPTRIVGGKSVASVPSRLASGLTPEDRQRVLDAYGTFGKKVREHIGADVELIESDHFLIWTDWERRDQPRLVEWCESMYAALCAQFAVGVDEQVFLAKCPVFCWRSKTRFLKFARLFDAYTGSNAVGYTRSIEASGHVHVVLLRQGRSAADFDRFAGTLVHEGTHAFLHRIYSSRLIPHWINEGYADLVAERVLGDRSPNGENARLLARQFVRHDWPIENLLAGTGPIEVHQYPIAHSVVAYLESSGNARFAAFVEHLKQGRLTAEALALSYDGMSLSQLESRWRESVRSVNPASSGSTNESKRQDLRGDRE